MKSTLQSRFYTNIILTAIAVLLFALAMDAYRVSPGLSLATTANAQDPLDARTRTSFAAPGRSAPTDSQNVPMVQDLAVAGATSEVAAANREIASAIRDLAKAVQDVGGSLEKKPAPAARAAMDSGGTMVEVNP